MLYLYQLLMFPLRIALSVAAFLTAILAFYFSSAFSEDASFVPQETLESVEEHIPAQAMSTLKEIAEYLKAPQKYQEISLMKPHAYLLVDFTEDSRSIAAVKALAGEAKANFFKIAREDFDNPKRLKQSLQRVKKLKKAVLVVEGLEALAPVEASGTNLDVSLRIKMVNKLLAAVEEAPPGVIFFAPIKSVANLDPAVYRPGRFDHIETLFPKTTHASKGPIHILIPMWLINMLTVLLPTILQLLLASGGASLGASLSSITKSLHEVILNSEVKFDHVQGCDEVKAQLMQIVDFLKNPAKYEKFGAAMPRGYLLTGPPGVGKTMLAKAVAGEAGVPFLAISGAEFDEVYIGSGSARVRNLFADARKHNKAVIFIDEIDAVATRRGSSPSQTNQIQTLNQLLVEMDGFRTTKDKKKQIIVLAATNAPDRLDPSILRPGRFDHTLVLSLPDIEGRRRIISNLLEEIPKDRLDPEITAQSLAQMTIGFTGADLANFINRAKLFGSSEESATLLTKAHFIKAKDFINLGPERSMVMSEADRERTAFHEAGHAIVALATPGSFPVQQATIVPHSEALGLVLTHPDEDINHMSKAMLQAKIDMALGGFLAEELKYGAEQVSFGPASDLKTVNQLAKQMVLSGFGKRTGFFQLSENALSSEAAKQNFEDDAKDILQEAKARVVAILRERNGTWIAIAKALIEHETLTREQLEEIYRKQQ